MKVQISSSNSAATPGNRLRRYHRFPTFIAYCLLVAWLPGCVSGLNIKDVSDDDEDESIAQSYCEPATVPTAEIVTVSAGTEANPIQTTSRYSVAASIAPLPFSPRAQQVAAIIGVDGLLAEFNALEKEMAHGLEGASLRFLTVRQELSDRLLLALFEANSIAAELECEKARTEDIASRLEDIRNDVQQGRTILAILADSISGVFAGTFLLVGAEIISGIIDLTGSAAALGFGVAALGGDQSYELSHGRNLMTEIWHGGQSSNQFPAPVWRYLNWPVRETSKRSRRENIVGSWRARLGKPGTNEERRRADLFFGEGGVYRISELRHRGEMLGLLKTHVNLMTQDLNLLFRETLHRKPLVKSDPT
ncbi:MAG: exported protein of unknown function [Nitrospira sp.]|nr:exported protein of unknown function [Nitrospira sp.]